MRTFLINMLKFTRSYNIAKKLQNKYNLLIGEGHGHSLLLKLIKQKKKFSRSGLRFLEIGASRENIFGQGSTKLIAEFCENNQINFTSVDADKKNVENIKNDLSNFKYFKIIYDTGENFSKVNKDKLDILYLDAFDIETPNIPTERIKFYRETFNKEITNHASAEMHKDVIVNLLNNLNNNCLIVFDDTFIINEEFFGKGQSAIPILLKQGFKIIGKNKNSVALERVINE